MTDDNAPRADVADSDVPDGGTRPRGMDVLEALRAELDSIDELLLDNLRARIACCVEIAQVKAEHGVPMMQPHRIGIVQQRAAEYGEEHGIDRVFLRRLYELVIDETCRVEDLVIGGADPRPVNDSPDRRSPGRAHEVQKAVRPCALS